MNNTEFIQLSNTEVGSLAKILKPNEVVLPDGLKCVKSNYGTSWYIYCSDWYIHYSDVMNYLRSYDSMVFWYIDSNGLHNTKLQIPNIDEVRREWELIYQLFGDKLLDDNRN